MMVIDLLFVQTLYWQGSLFVNTENCSKVVVLVPRLPGGSVIFLPGSWFNTPRKNISVKQLCYR